VIPEIDRHLANRAADGYADDAEANADRHADELRPKGQSRRSAPKLETKGDQVGAAIRRRVTVAIEQLTDTTGPPN
jgi:hypothetical protein